MEQKIEQVLRSTSPSECFTEGSVNPVVFVSLAAETIAYAGNAEAVRQIGKLIKLDEKRFGDLVDRALMEAEDARGGNPYVLAYQGLELGDPLVQKRVYAWFQARLVDKDEYRLRDLRKFWAEALVDRYGGAPTGSQWAADPFVSRVNPSDEPALHKAMLGLTIDVVQRRQKQ
jgi:hypothetical protein